MDGWNWLERGSAEAKAVGCTDRAPHRMANARQLHRGEQRVAQLAGRLVRSGAYTRPASAWQSGTSGTTCARRHGHRRHRRSGSGLAVRENTTETAALVAQMQPLASPSMRAAGLPPRLPTSWLHWAVRASARRPPSAPGAAHRGLRSGLGS